MFTIAQYLEVITEIRSRYADGERLGDTEFRRAVYRLAGMILMHLASGEGRPPLMGGPLPANPHADDEARPAPDVVAELLKTILDDAAKKS